MSKEMIFELIELGVACFIMVICVVMMFYGIDSEVKTVFIMGATLAIRTGFNIKHTAKEVNNARK